MTRKTFWSLFTIAAVLRIFMLGRAPLWYDENFTLILARLPFMRMIAATAGDVHPPLWYLIEWTIYHAAPSLPAWAIRIPALIFSLLAFVMFVHVCNALYIPERIMIAAAAMMAIMPMQLWYAQEGRMYAMLEFLVLAALWTGLTRQWFYFFLASLAMLYTQNYGVFYLSTILLLLMVIEMPRLFMTHTDLTAIALSAIAAVLLYSPWAFVIAQQMDTINGRYWIVNAGAGAALNAVYKQFWSMAMYEPGVIPSFVLTFAALIIGVYLLMRERHAAWWPVLAMAFGPLALAWIVSVFWQPLLLFRPLIGTAPFLYLIIVWPIEALRAPSSALRSALYVSCFAAPLLVFGIGGYYVNIPAMKGEGVISPLLTVMHYVRAHWQPGDVIYYTDDGPMINLMPYADDLPQYRMPSCDEKTGFAPVLGSLSDTTRTAIGMQVADLDDVTYTRAWVFAPRSPLHPLCYEDQIRFIAVGDPLITVDDNEFISSGVWLVEKN